MNDERSKRQQPHVLSDHRRIGKRFVPPFMTITPQLNEVRWIDILPELLWLGLLNDRLGLRRGAQISAAVAKAFTAETKSFELWAAQTSAYSAFTAIQAEGFRRSLQGDKLVDLRTAIRPLLALYPACPLRICFGPNETIKADESDLNTITDGVDALLDRGGNAATFAQANAIYIGFVSGKIKVAAGLALADFPAIENYPNTEQAKRVASGVRAAVTGLSGRGWQAAQETPSEWTRYFWRRGLELAPCVLQD